MIEVYLRQGVLGTEGVWVQCDKGDLGAVAFVKQTPTACDLLRRLDTFGEEDSSRLIVMAQNPAANYHWTKGLGQFTAGEVRAALKVRQ